MDISKIINLISGKKEQTNNQQDVRDGAVVKKHLKAVQAINASRPSGSIVMISGQRLSGKSYALQNATLEFVKSTGNAAIVFAAWYSAKRFLKNIARTHNQSDVYVNMSRMTASFGSNTLFCFSRDYSQNNPVDNPSLLASHGIRLCSVDDICPENEKLSFRLVYLVSTAALTSTRLAFAVDVAKSRHSIFKTITDSYWRGRIFKAFTFFAKDIA